MYLLLLNMTYHKMFVILIFLCIFHSVASAVLDKRILLLRDVLRIRNTNYVIVYNCWKYTDALRVKKSFDDDNIRASFQKLGENYSYEFNNRKSPTESYVLDATCEEMRNVLIQFNDKHKFRSSYKWYILMEDDAETNAAKLFKGLRLRMDSDVLLLNYKFETFSIDDLYDPGGDEVISTTVGEWRYDSEGLINFSRAINTMRYKERSDMTDVHLRMGITTEQQDAAVRKLSRALINTLQKIHNFTIIFIPTKKTNDSNKVDVLGTMMYMNEKVMSDYDLIIPAYPFRQCFVYKRSETTKNEYLAPFSSSVWYCTICLAFLVCVVIKLVLNMEGKSHLDGDVSWTSAFLIMISVYCQQGTSIVPKYTAGRIVVLCLLIISVHLYNSYVSIMVSSLLYPLASTFKNPDELMSDNFELGFEKADFNPYVQYNSGFAFGNDDIRYKNARFRYHDVFEGLDKIRRGQFAFHTEVGTRYPIISKKFSPSEICELQEFDVFRKVYLSLVTAKHSQYTKLFKISFRRVMERGILRREILSLLAEKPPCLANIDEKQLSFKYVLPAFVVFAFGSAIAIFFLLLELTVSYT